MLPNRIRVLQVTFRVPFRTVKNTLVWLNKLKTSVGDPESRHAKLGACSFKKMLNMWRDLSSLNKVLCSLWLDAGGEILYEIKTDHNITNVTREPDITAPRLSGTSSSGPVTVFFSDTEFTAGALLVILRKSKTQMNVGWQSRFYELQVKLQNLRMLLKTRSNFNIISKKGLTQQNHCFLSPELRISCTSLPFRSVYI